MIPPECMEYTDVFRAVKLEVVISFVIGVLLGLFIWSKHDP